MTTVLEHALHVEDSLIDGYAQRITVRGYRPAAQRRAAPLLLYFHGGRFNDGSLADAGIPAAAIARASGAWVLAVGYSLAPAFPFPAALEDGYRALQWAVQHAAANGADAQRIGLAGHDAGGNLATCIAAMARDRREVRISAQALIAPLLDPSLTHQLPSDGQRRLVTHAHAQDMNTYASCYRAYLPNPMQRLHPYAAPPGRPAADADRQRRIRPAARGSRQICGRADRRRHPDRSHPPSPCIARHHRHRRRGPRRRRRLFQETPGQSAARLTPFINSFTASTTSTTSITSGVVP